MGSKYPSNNVIDKNHEKYLRMGQKRHSDKSRETMCINVN